jgi:outer membrane protein assembly factor BamA
MPRLSRDLVRALVGAALMTATARTWAAPSSRSSPPSAPTELPGERAAFEVAAPAPASEAAFGPGYVIESIAVVGNHKTDTALIVRELGLAAGDVIGASDLRVEAARLRLLSLGFFLDVRLSLTRGVRRGGAVLTVTVEERGTVVLSGLFLGASEATQLWAGLDLTEMNFLGRGLLLEGGFVTSTTPTVPGARAGKAVRMRFAGPDTLSGLAPTMSLIASDGSEFFRAYGAPSDVAPAKQVAVGTRRIGGTVGVATALAPTVQLQAQARFELLHADFPDLRHRDLGGGLSEPIDFSIDEGASRVASLELALDVDTRNDPVLPHSGRRLLTTIETSSPAIGSSYSFAKGTLQGWAFRPIGSRGHTLGVNGFIGAVFGAAPYFDRFFVGDLNLLLPPRVLGLNFSTLPSRDLLGSAIEEHRYDDYAGRVMVEYAVPLIRRRGFVYRGDAFVAIGVFAMASDGDLRARDRSFASSLPVDLTADLGVRLDTYIGIFNLSVANALGRIPF